MTPDATPDAVSLGLASSSSPVRVFVSAVGNQFMVDIADAIVEACGELGRDAELVVGGLPAAGAVNLVVAPHEFFALHDADDRAIAAALPHTITLSTEQPGTPWFETGLRYASRARARYDINRHGADAATARGVATRWLQLGATRSMAAAMPATGRDIDVLFLGGDTPRRRALLAALAPALQAVRAELRLFPIDRPVDQRTPGLVFGADKYALLARSRVLLNIHRDERHPAYFEWARMVEAMANGCVVVTEPTDGCAPLVAGRHFVAADGPDGLATALTDALADTARMPRPRHEMFEKPEVPVPPTSTPGPTRTLSIADAGHRAVTEEWPLRASIAELLADVECAPAPAPRRPRRWNRRRPLGSPPRVRRDAAPLPPFRPFRVERQALYDAFLDEVSRRRRIDALRCTVEFGATSHVTLTPSVLHTERRAADDPIDVSVVVTLYDYEHYVGEALDSLAEAVRSTTEPAAGAVEIVVVDDHSSDAGRAVVERFITTHPQLDVLLVARDDNQGLARARNTGVANSHGRYVMMLDADNAVYPHALGRLRAALDADPDAAVAYGILEDFGSAPGLRSHLPWNIEWLVAANYIDAQAMFRRTAFERFGGYIDDDLDAYGWEDWELWLRFAAGGGHGVLVPEILGRYRTHPGSMVAITNLVGDTLRQRMIARHPELPWNA